MNFTQTFEQNILYNQTKTNEKPQISGHSDTNATNTKLFPRVFPTKEGIPLLFQPPNKIKIRFSIPGWHPPLKTTVENF